MNAMYHAVKLPSTHENSCRFAKKKIVTRVFATILNIIIVTARRRRRTHAARPPPETASPQVLFFGRNGRIYHSGGHRHWNVGFYIFFMIFSLIYLAVRVWVSLIVTKLYSLLMKIGEHRAKEVDDHHSYDAKCACMP